MQLIAIVVHDVAPATARDCERVLRCLEQIAPLPVTLLATPRWHLAPHDAAFERWIDALVASGDEVALHGYTHIDDGAPRGWLDLLKRRCYTRGEGEFAALGASEAALRIAAGVRWFEERGWPLSGFVAPAWLLSAGTWCALDRFPFSYTCTLSGLVALPARQRVRSQAIVYSTESAWRRTASLGWNALVARGQRDARLLRLELHPSDVRHGAIRRAWMRLAERALGERRAVTLDQAVRLLAGTRGRVTAT